VEVQLPEAPPVDSTNITISQEDGESTSGKTYGEREAEKAALVQATSNKVLIPNRLKIINTPPSLAMLSNAVIQTKVVTQDGTVVPILGVGKDNWKGTLTVFKGPDNGRLLGSTQIEFTNGYANFTDVRFSKSGEYNVSIKVTYPSDFPYEVYVGLTATKLADDSKARRIQFTFDGAYDTIVTDKAAFLASFKAALLAKFPGTTLSDLDVYKGSIIIEATVSSDSSSDTTKKIESMKTEFETGKFEWTYDGNNMNLGTFDGDSGKGSGGMSGGTIALAVILAVIVVVLLVGLAILVYKKKFSHRKTVPDSGIVMTNKGTKNDPSPSGGNEYGTAGGAGNKPPTFDEEEDNWLSHCKNCEKEKKTWPCPICRAVRYCSKECQQEHWPTHFNGQCKPRSASFTGDVAV